MNKMRRLGDGREAWREEEIRQYVSLFVLLFYLAGIPRMVLTRKKTPQAFC